MIEIQYRFEEKGFDLWKINTINFPNVDEAIRHLEKFYKLTFDTEFVYYGCSILYNDKVYFRFLELDTNELISIKSKSPWYVGL